MLSLTAVKEQGRGFSPVLFSFSSVPKRSSYHLQGLQRMVANSSVSTGEPSAAVPYLPIGPGISFLTRMTQASAAGQASPRWGGLCQESAG